MQAQSDNKEEIDEAVRLVEQASNGENSCLCGPSKCFVFFLSLLNQVHILPPPSLPLHPHPLSLRTAQTRNHGFTPSRVCCVHSSACEKVKVERFRHDRYAERVECFRRVRIRVRKWCFHWLVLVQDWYECFDCIFLTMRETMRKVSNCMCCSLIVILPVVTVS